MVLPLVFKLRAELLIQPAYIGSRSSNIRRYSLITRTIFWVMFTCCHFFHRENLLMEQFLIQAMKEVTLLNLIWALDKWSKVINMAMNWLLSVLVVFCFSVFFEEFCFSVSLSEFLYFLCRMGSGSPGNVRWWKAEVEDPIKAWLWASRLATYYPWYVFFLIFSALCLLSIQLW
jgi:hypothetical protein